MFTGDSLVTDHPISRRPPGPQLLRNVFNEDEATMLRSLERLRSVPADIVVPGHGSHLEAPLSDVVDRVLASRS